MPRIPCKTIVAIQGDDYPNEISNVIKEKIILPFIDIRCKEFDLSLENRKRTKNEVVAACTNAIRQHKVAVKCWCKNSILELPTPENYAVEATLKHSLKGNVFREPMEPSHGSKVIMDWKQTIVIGHPGSEGIYNAQEIEITVPGTLKLVFTNEIGHVTYIKVHEFTGRGVALVMYATDEAIKHFAHASFHYALWKRLPMYFTVATDIFEIYDGRFRTIFNDIYTRGYKDLFAEKKISYTYMNLQSMGKIFTFTEGGYLWCVKVILKDLIFIVV